MDDFGEIAVGCIGFILIATVVIFLVSVAVTACLTVGTVYGAGMSLYNYGLAFRRNVHLERSTP